MARRPTSGDLEGIESRWTRRLFSTSKVAASAARLAARQLVGAKGATDGAIGEAIARELDQMKGMAMKVGQILSYLDGILPEETHAALTRLQTGVKPVAFETMAAVLETALGPVDEAFEAFDRKPVAAASIGQVFKARFEGRPVAVKIQYPGIRDTIDLDFSRLLKLGSLASIGTAVDGRALVKELRERFVEECDYRREAFHQQAFADAFSDDETIVVPGVVEARTTPEILTSDWMDGVGFYDLVRDGSQAERDRVALVLTRFAYRSLYGLGTLNADPHPGNYLFAEDGRVVFLDFGCVRRFEDDYLAADRHLSRVVVDGRRSAFDDALAATGMVGRRKGFDFDHHWDMLRWMLEPYLTPRYTFTAGYLKRTMEFGRPTDPNLRKLAIPPQWIWLQRLQFGLHSVLTRLGASGPFRDVFHHALDAPLVRLPEAPTGD